MEHVTALIVMDEQEYRRAIRMLRNNADNLRTFKKARESAAQDRSDARVQQECDALESDARTLIRLAIQLEAALMKLAQTRAI